MKIYKMKSLKIAIIFLLSSHFVLMSKTENKNNDVVLSGMVTGSVNKK